MTTPTNSQKKTGFKLTNNMRCKTLTYEIGKEYSITNKEMCHHGFHYCSKLVDTLDYGEYDLENPIFIEVEDLDPESNSDEWDITVSDHIRVLRVVPKEELPDYIKFDSHGNLVENGRWKRSFDSNGNLLEFENANGFKSWRTYNDKNQQLTYQDAWGETWKYFYDSDGNQIECRYNKKGGWKSSYDSNGNELTYTRSDGFTRSFTYDSDGNQTSCTNSNDFNWKKTYDSNGNELTYEDTSGFKRTTVYDFNGNVVKYEDSNGFAYYNTWDDKGNLIAYFDSKGTDWTITIK